MPSFSEACPCRFSQVAQTIQLCTWQLPIEPTRRDLLPLSPATTGHTTPGEVTIEHDRSSKMMRAPETGAGR